MPDLVSHVVFAYAISRYFTFSRRVLFYTGAILPDIITRPIYILIPQLYPYTIAVHTPVFMIFFTLFFAELFEKKIRQEARIFLFAGVLSHFLLDALQKHIHAGGYFWFFPFSWNAGSLGLFWPHEPLKLIPLWVFLILAVEVGIFFYNRRRKQVNISSR
ncbi:hypothetical protein JW935_09105 [candidate division KSB1 bacterium]|nr:hypothetical protein [candidate division KSB1 bacterium]